MRKLLELGTHGSLSPHLQAVNVQILEFHSRAVLEFFAIVRILSNRNEIGILEGPLRPLLAPVSNAVKYFLNCRRSEPKFAILWDLTSAIQCFSTI